MIKTYRCPWINRGQVYFAIVYTPRSGSNYLAELLDSAQHVTCHTEIFNPKSTYLSRQTKVAYIDKATRDKDLWGFLRHLVAEASDVKAFGFKIGMYDLRSMLIYVLCSRRVKKLIIQRRNLLASFISLKEAERSNSWIQWRKDQEQIAALPKLKLSLMEFYLYALKMQIFYAFVRILEKVTLQDFKWIPYEVLVRSLNKDDICHFLGVDVREEFFVRTRKQNQSPIRDKIHNIRSFEYSLRAVNAGWMLHENN